MGHDLNSLKHKGPNQPMHSVKEICDFFFEIEKKHRLFEYSFQNIYIWQIVRLSLYYQLTRKVEVFDSANQVPSKTKLHRLASYFIDFFTFFKSSSYLFKKHETILISCDRKLNGLDIYSLEVQKNIPNLLILDQNPGIQKQVISLKFPFRLIGSFTKRFSGKVPKKIRDLAVLINQELEERFQWRFEDLDKYLYKESILFKWKKRIYKSLFKQQKAKTLYLVCFYYKLDAVAAAQELDLNVIELQHGTFTPFHLGYSFPEKKPPPYFPNELHCFGKFWPENTPLPNKTKIKIIPTPYIKTLSSTKIEKKNKNLIVFSSQPVIGKALFLFAMKCAELAPEYFFIFRLHPSESSKDYDIPSKIQNFEISKKSPNIFALLNSAEYVAGVFSTTMFEAMSLGAKVILINMSGIEYMTPVIKRKDAVLANTPDEFIEKLKEACMAKDPGYYYQKLD
jgi:hypothetical protein